MLLDNGCGTLISGIFGNLGTVAPAYSGSGKPWLLGMGPGATDSVPSGQKSGASVVLASKLLGTELVAATLSWHMLWALSGAKYTIECIWLGGNGPEGT